MSIFDGFLVNAGADDGNVNGSGGLPAILGFNRLFKSVRHLKFASHIRLGKHLGEV